MNEAEDIRNEEDWDLLEDWPSVIAPDWDI